MTSFLRNTITFVTLLIIFAPVSHADYESTHQDMAEQINRRLSLMPAVACYKYVNRLPITDEVREAQLLTSLRDKARELQIDPDYVERFFIAQIEAAKVYQEITIRDYERTVRAQTRRKFGNRLVFTGRNRSIIECEADLPAIRQELDSISAAMLNDLKKAEINTEQLFELLDSALPQRVRKQAVNF